MLMSEASLHIRPILCSVQSRTHEVNQYASTAEQDCQHIETRSVCLLRSLKFKYEKGGRRDMVNKTPNLCKAEENMFLTYYMLNTVKAVSFLQ